MSTESTSAAPASPAADSASGKTARRQRVLSGVQPTNALHLGNYLGAIRQWAKLLDEHDCFFCIVDLHAITVRQDAAELRRRSRELAALYIACGIDPEKATIFLQSHVPEHCELQWILSTFTQFGELNKMTQFKDKAKKHKENISAGLFTYPVLMAADILLYDAERVPVGHDQKQHLELTRNIAERFNNHYEKPVFVVPEPMIGREGARVMDLQHPDKKMSKSEAGKGMLGLLDPLPELKNKIKRAVTDSLGVVAANKEDQPGVANLLNILGAIEGKSAEEVAQRFEGQGYGELKEAVAEAVAGELGPIQERFQALNNKKTLDPILAAGAERARRVASRTLARAKKAVGFVLPGE